MHLFARTNLLRRRDETVAARVTQIELFFDNATPRKIAATVNSS